MNTAADKFFNKPENLKVLCLMTVARSGSKFFHSLVDGHPQVICFPRKLKFCSFWQRVSNKKDNPVAIVDAFIERYPHYFSGACWYKINKYERANQLGPKMNETFSLDIDVFRQKTMSLLKDKEISRATMFLALHFAYCLATKRQIPEEPLIFYHIHDAEHEEELQACVNDFPRTRVLLTTRNPLQSLDSEVGWMKMHNKVSAKTIFKYYRAIVYDVSNLLVRFPDTEIRVLPFEMLHKQSRNILRKFCEWTGIEWDDALLQSTMHGKIWWGNGKNPRNGFNSNWKDYTLTPCRGLKFNDWLVIGALLHKRMKLYGYVDNEDVRCLKRPVSWIRYCLPTATEWEIVKLIFSLSHWFRVVRYVMSDLVDPRLRGYDYYLKHNVMDVHNNSSSMVICMISLLTRLVRTMILLIWKANPIVAFKTYIERICFYRKMRDSTNLARMPKLL